MKKFAIMITSVLATLTVSAQETYENARLMETDLNGTARYVAMGGAMDALGADISTISTNPAGIGLCYLRIHSKTSQELREHPVSLIDVLRQFLPFIRQIDISGIRHRNLPRLPQLLHRHTDTAFFELELIGHIHGTNHRQFFRQK